MVGHYVTARLPGKDNEAYRKFLRGAWALIHGFIMFELSGQFRRGGDLESAFIESVQAYLDGWAQRKDA